MFTCLPTFFRRSLLIASVISIPFFYASLNADPFVFGRCGYTESEEFSLSFFDPRFCNEADASVFVIGKNKNEAKTSEDIRAKLYSGLHLNRWFSAHISASGAISNPNM